MTDSKSVIQVINTPTQTQISADVTYLTTGVRKASRKGRFEDDEEPLVDNTVALPKRSKKTDRAQRRLVQKQQKAAERPTAATLLDLPTELLEHVLGFLMPSDVLRLLSVSHTVQSFILETANAISRTIIRRRFGVLSRCFPLPVPFKDVESSAHPALLSERRQDMLQIHKKPYQHVKGIDPLKVCTCLSCVFAWNNLCLVLDLAYWQKTLDKKEPIPMIKRGSAPEWNRKLLDQNAEIVERAMEGDSLSYAMILEKHLRSTMGTLLRTYRGKKTVHPKRLYHFSAVEAEKESDEFLERSGPPSVSLNIPMYLV